MNLLSPIPMSAFHLQKRPLKIFQWEPANSRSNSKLADQRDQFIRSIVLQDTRFEANYDSFTPLAKIFTPEEYKAVGEALKTKIAQRVKKGDQSAEANRLRKLTSFIEHGQYDQVLRSGQL